MPYIQKKDRVRAAVSPVTEGELNFAITRLVNNYMLLKGLSYAHINEAMGAMEGAKLEFYRRVAIPYENTKIQANGDVYSPSLVPRPLGLPNTGAPVGTVSDRVNEAAAKVLHDPSNNKAAKTARGSALNRREGPEPGGFGRGGKAAASKGFDVVMTDDEKPMVLQERRHPEIFD